MTSSTVSSEYEVTIPREMADQLGWRPGRQLAFIPEGNGALLLPIPKGGEPVGAALGANAEGYRHRYDR